MSIESQIVHNNQTPTQVNLKKIHKGLWLGNVAASESMLRTSDNSKHGPKLGVCIASERTCQVCVASDRCMAVTGFPDSSSLDKESFEYGVDQAASMIHEQLKHGEVMVNCYAGINRSASAIVAYSVKYRNWNAVDAIQYIREMNYKHRDGLPALTNDTFVMYLASSPQLRPAAKSELRRLEGGVRNIKARRTINNMIKQARRRH